MKSRSWFVDEAIAQNIKTTDVYADAAPLSARAMAIGVDWLKRADRYRIEIPLIPYGGEERVDASLNRFAFGLTTPSEISVIEYEHGGIYDMKPDLTRALATRRIALCVDLASTIGIDAELIDGFQRAPDDHGGILVWSINYFDEKREWEFAPGIAVIPRYQARKHLASKSFAESSLDVIKKKLGLEKPEPDTMVVHYHEMLPEICDKLGDEHRGRVIRESNMDAMWTALGFFSAFGCENTLFDDVARSMSVASKGGVRVPLDPFHGERKKSLLKDVWLQGSRFSVDELPITSPEVVGGAF